MAVRSGTRAAEAESSAGSGASGTSTWVGTPGSYTCHHARCSDSADVIGWPRSLGFGTADSTEVARRSRNRQAVNGALPIISGIGRPVVCCVVRARPGDHGCPARVALAHFDASVDPTDAIVGGERVGPGHGRACR